MKKYIEAREEKLATLMVEEKRHTGLQLLGFEQCGCNQSGKVVYRPLLRIELLNKLQEQPVILKGALHSGGWKR